MEKLYVGVDGGIQGGVAILDDDCKVVNKWIMPVINADKKEFDINEINRIFDEIKLIGKDSNIIVGLEKANPRPIQGIRASFTTGLCFGLFQGILVSKSISYEIINPAVWMKKVFEGHQTDDKKASVMFCQRKWSDVNWKATERCSTIHTGLSDAVCIAYFLYLKNRGQNEQNP